MSDSQTITEVSDSQTITEMGILFRKLKDTKGELESQLKDVNSQINALRFTLMPSAFEDGGIESIRIAGIGLIHLRGDMYVSIVKDKDNGIDKTTDAHRWLIENGFGDIIVPYIHPSTLKALVKEQYTKGETFPEELFKITPFTEARLLK